MAGRRGRGGGRWWRGEGGGVKVEVEVSIDNCEQLSGQLTAGEEAPRFCVLWKRRAPSLRIRLQIKPGVAQT